MNIAIILAGGIGVRVGSNIPKQFIEVFGKPVLVYTIEKFQNNPNIDAIEIVCLKSYIPNIEEFKNKYNLSKIKWVAEGGSTFQESVLNGVNYLEGKVADDDIVVIHFGASPFIEDDIINDCIKVSKEKGNAISTIPFYYLSTFRDEDNPDTMAGKWVSRDTLACMNSPHAFQYGYVRNLYKRAIESGDINKVEPHTTTLMQYMGEKIYFSKGSQTNIKITTAEDLDLFKGYVLLNNLDK